VEANALDRTSAVARAKSPFLMGGIVRGNGHRVPLWPN
jgi:hypothetical protein